MSYHVILPGSYQDLAMILTSVPCIMICHDLDKGTMVTHDSARLTMILESVACLRSLGFDPRSSMTTWLFSKELFSEYGTH